MFSKHKKWDSNDNDNRILEHLYKDSGSDLPF